MKNILAGTSLLNVFVFYIILDAFGFVCKHLYGFSPEQMVSYLNIVSVLMMFRLIIPYHVEKYRSQLYIKKLSDEDLRAMMKIIEKNDENNKKE